MASPYECEIETEFSSAAVSNNVFCSKASFPTLAEVKELDLTEEQKEGLPKLQELIKKETAGLINYSYPFHKNNVHVVKYAARMIGRHYDLEVKKEKDEEMKVDEVVVKAEVEESEKEVKKEGEEEKKEEE